MSIHTYDVVVIGSGAAGLALALSLPKNYKIAVMSKAHLKAGSSTWAQGGIAAVMDANDSIEAHIADTLTVGAGLCDPTVVHFAVKNSKKAITWLSEQGVEFTRQTNNSNLHLNQEGGHSQRRLVHVEDRTGSAVIHRLLQQIKKRKNIFCFTHYTAVDLLIKNKRCTGVKSIDDQHSQFIYFYSQVTVLATGGVNSVYQQTTNPDCASGDGIAMAYRAGCRIANLEFMQFHPTCLYHSGKEIILISEAMRGEGAHLILENGERFMLDYDRRGELAPRDIVSRSIADVMQKNQLPCVYLDITHKSATEIKKHFPTLYRKCLALNVDITQQPIPVIPAAHYTCGGVITDIFGKTDLPGLYAIGEVAYTGLHGANRMGSNSLLECLVFAASTAQNISTVIKNNFFIHADHTIKGFKKINTPLTSFSSVRKDLRELMTQKVVIVRSNQSLQFADEKIQQWQTEIMSTNMQAAPTQELIETQNLLQVAALIVQSAKLRHESRGTHYNIDYPQTSSTAKNTVLQQNPTVDLKT